MAWCRGLGGVVLATVLAATSGLVRPLASQGNCNVPNGNGNCVIADNATQSATITITRAVRLSLANSGVALELPTPADFDAGFGQTVGPALTIKANTGWNIAIRSLQASWSATGPDARAGKPRSDLQWGISPAGPFTDVTATDVTMQTGAATAGTFTTLYWRVKYSWLLDTPGSYTLPLQLTLTAP